MKVIVNDSEGQRLNGKEGETDLFQLVIDGITYEISGRMHIGNGVWRVWNDEIYWILEEVK